jgi:chemotaxis family two-component system response regulator Rcp1
MGCGGDSIDIQNTIEILLIEDNPAETRLIVEIFSEETPKINISKVKDGFEAINYLNKKGEYKDSKKPNLIILDLNIPKKKGHEVLKEIKIDKKLKCIPVVVLTSSSDDEDIMESYKHYASAYMVKPVDYDTFKETMCAFRDYWLNSAVLPQVE